MVTGGNDFLISRHWLTHAGARCTQGAGSQRRGEGVRGAVSPRQGSLGVMP